MDFSIPFSAKHFFQCNLVFCDSLDFFLTRPGIISYYVTFPPVGQVRLLKSSIFSSITVEIRKSRISVKVKSRGALFTELQVYEHNTAEKHTEKS